MSVTIYSPARDQSYPKAYPSVTVDSAYIAASFGVALPGGPYKGPKNRTEPVTKTRADQA